MDWSDIKYFAENEFFGQAEFLNEQTIYNLDEARNIIKEPIYLSPARGAIARFGGSTSSQHFIGSSPSKIIRKSTAVDVFAEGIPFLNFSTLLHSKLFSGIGIYLDTKGPDGDPWVMFHLDNRTSYSVDKPLVWVCIKDIEPSTNRLANKYFYPQNNSEYWHLLKRHVFFAERTN